MYISSPEASFLDFNYKETNSCDDEDNIALPVCGDVGIKAQIDIHTDELLDTVFPFYVALCDNDCNVILDNNTQVQPICDIRKFNLIIEDTEISDTDPLSLCSSENLNDYIDINFNPNPFDLITSSDFSFDFQVSPVGKQLQLYIEDKIYIIEWNVIPTNYDYTIQGNVYFVKIHLELLDANSKNNLLSFLNDIIDVNHSTTSSYAGATFTIENIPANSYINNNEWISSPSTITVSNNIGKFFYYNNNILHYAAIGSTLQTIYYSFNYYLPAHEYSFKFYYSSLYTNFVGNITFDDGVNPPTVVPFSITDYSGEIEALYTSTGATYNITINITDAGNHYNGFNITGIRAYYTQFFNVVASVSDEGYVSVPLGIYSKQGLIDKISELLGVDFNCQYSSCCELPNMQFQVDYGEGLEVTGQYTLRKYWNKGYIDFPAVSACGTTYRYNYQYIGVNDFEFDFCNFTNAYFEDIYIEGIPNNFGGVTITDENELWLGILSAWGAAYYPICIDIDINIIYPEIVFKVVNSELGVCNFKMTRTVLSENCIDCFTYAILDLHKNVIGCSNLFRVSTDCCYVTKIEYSNNEDAFGFSYPTGIKNTIQLPFYINSPKHIVKEKVYRNTDGTYKRLSADIEKEYDCETDYLKEYLHDKLIVALKHDTVVVISNRLNTTAAVSQQGDYQINWNNKTDFTAKAEFKLRTYFNGKNNNCGGNC
mgnify:CR=1 FL=1